MPPAALGALAPGSLSLGRPARSLPLGEAADHLGERRGASPQRNHMLPAIFVLHDASGGWVSQDIEGFM
jgi:hypothetical protein